jgi:hypothetical protein
MAGKDRTLLRIALDGHDARPGEIPLGELAKIAERTQRVVRRLARGLLDRSSAGRLPKAVEQSTELFLVGLRDGSTVLEIAGSSEDDGKLSYDDLPPDIADRALDLLVGGVEVAASESADALPVGFDEEARDALDDWLKGVRHYSTVELELRAPSRARRRVAVTPTEARGRLAELHLPPRVPYVSASKQALVGVLYALNMRTGTYRIEDSLGNVISLTVPEDIRADAAKLAGQRVRALGRANLDRNGNVASFEVSGLSPSTTPAGLDREAFWTRHELKTEGRTVVTDLDRWVIEDLTDEEEEGFLAALSE